MRKQGPRSFRLKLLVSFLLVGVVPLLVCAALMLGVFQAALTRSARESALEGLADAGEQLDHFLARGAEIILELRENPDVTDALVRGGGDRPQKIYNALYSQLQELRGAAHFFLFDRDGRCLYSTDSPGGERDLPVQWGVLRAARLGEGVVFSGSRGLLQIACAVHGDNTGILGYVMMALNNTQLVELLEGLPPTAGSVLLLDAYWGEISRSVFLRGEDLAAQLRERLLKGQPLSDGESNAYYLRQSPATGLYLVAQQPAPVAGWVMRLLRLIYGLSIALCLGVCLAVAMGLSRQLFAPIFALNQAMGKVEDGNLEMRLEVSGTDEMAQLFGRFNRMTGRLSAYLEESIRRQKELNDAQIRMMQAQLNPHFLYNTLDTVKWMGKINRIPQVATIAADLADILRRSISGEEFVPLSDELSLLDRYVEIQAIRFPGKFQLVRRIEPDTVDIPVPRLMLQPLVENSILHGFENVEGGQVTISSLKVGEELIVTVRDNGCGMTGESIRRFEQQTSVAEGHLGLFNVNAILQLHYGPEYGLRIVPIQGPGTCIRITLPIVREEADPHDEGCGSGG